ncbi:hypothetical protein F7R91_23975 [Streptomyces luteolifulvus]|jgi:hypothetical protein|uniref:C2H2-type domain-containing protein n=1 Tax=Streptomyces luteolifulvus TaxID=2615112 RepID=A0A6H9UVC5_9ACTN|nr:hypothetical protein [Streptomyces luteolifulvus]KAB1143980.1 hypothetical protein F7R91_23975 [Streptomyces luteolifulvus]
MSEIAGQIRDAATAVVHESYSFACMRCGHGWEQSYEIEHHTDAEGHEFVIYVANGRVVPSPLSRPACHNCDGHVVRIMRAGQVSTVLHAVHPPAPRKPEERAEPVTPGEPGEPKETHHWHLSDLLHAFHRKAG